MAELSVGELPLSAIISIRQNQQGKRTCRKMVRSVIIIGKGWIEHMIDWEQVRVDAAVSAMQGVLESGKLGEILESAPEIVARQAVRMADALIEELKKNGEE